MMGRWAPFKVKSPIKEHWKKYNSCPCDANTVKVGKYVANESIQIALVVFVEWLLNMGCNHLGGVPEIMRKSIQNLQGS